MSIIGTALKELKAAIEPMISRSLSAALPTFHNYLNLQFQGVQRAFQYARINMLGNERLATVGAAAAAYRLGLCANYTEIDSCDSDKTQMSMKRVLTIQYTREALVVTTSPFKASRNGFDWTSDQAWNLGAIARPSQDALEVAIYWHNVHTMIRRWARLADAKRPITHVILIGESALNETFLRVVRDALRDGLPEVPPVQSKMTTSVEIIDPTYAAARGGAELAKRTLESPEDCVETTFCKWWRRHIT